MQTQVRMPLDVSGQGFLSLSLEETEVALRPPGKEASEFRYGTAGTGYLGD